jgi:hypothetical protein
MPTIPSLPLSLPNPQRTISQIIETQLPDFVRDADPTFIAFLKAYYEWLEKNGEEAYACKIIDATLTSVTLNPIPLEVSSNIALNAPSTKIDAYVGMHVVCTNGPTKGYTRKITAYDPVTMIATVDAWDSSFIPLPNTRISIRDALYPRTLLQYRDIDTTIDRFIDYFRDDFMYEIPGNILADKRNILKHIKDFYQARGTENSFRFLFRILFNQEMEFYYPKVDLFRASDGVWYVQTIMKTTTTTDTFGYVNRQLVGVYSGATASVESATQQYVAGGTITELTLSSVNGTFQIDPNTNLPEQVKISYPVAPPPQSDLGDVQDLEEPSTDVQWEQAYQLLQQLLINTPGENYQVGETITISGGGELAPATAVITSIFQTIYVGGCQPPPTTFYLEPYFGPDDTVNTNPDPQTDGVCIPGLYYFSDVHSDFSSGDLLNATQILLSANSPTQDNFFAGDEIDLIGGTGQGQRNTIVSYNGTTKVATVATAWTVIPDGTTEYSITHVKGGIQSIAITNFGLGFLTNPTVTIHTAEGSGAVLPPMLGITANTAGMWLPGKAGGIGDAPTTTDSFASSNKIIQDSFYWQDFSYDLRVGETIDKYRDIVKTLLHPAGLKMFGTVVSFNEPETNFLELVRVFTLLIGVKFFDLSLEVDNTFTLQFNTLTPCVVGARNKDLDAMKFYAFPPNYTFNRIYPFPNQNYWSTNGPGNTQISNFQNVVIGSIINFPERRTKINADAYVVITNGNSLTEVGVLGPNLGTLSQFRFIGFPPYEGFNETYPSPNQNYWAGSLGGYGNTQLSMFANLVIGDVLTDPRSIRSNICIDSSLLITNNQQSIPAVGNQVIYSFLEGINPQIVYNVSPNYSGTEPYDGTLGTSILSESNDGTFVSQGVHLNATNSEIVNATGVPVNLKECTVVVIASANDVSQNTTLVGMIPDSGNNGFAIDLRTGGAVSFRARYDGVEETVNFPPASIGSGNFFMAALRFNDGIITGNVETVQTLQTTDSISATFSTYPINPTTNSDGWYFGQPSVEFVPVAQNAALFKNSTFGSSKFGQTEVSASPTTMGYFDGYLAYALFYDRALFDYELDTIYNQLSVELFNERGVNLNAGTVSQTQQGSAAIRRTTQQTQLGGAYLKLTRLKTQNGVARIQRGAELHTITGLTRLQVTTVQTQIGAANIQHGATQTLTGLSRLQITTPHVITGLANLRNTTDRTQIGNTAIRNTTLKTQSGVTRITVSNNAHNIMGSADIYKTEFLTQLGKARIQIAGNERTMIGLSLITAATTQTQSGTARITILTAKTQSGVARLQVTTGPKTIAGSADIRTTDLQIQLGVSRIQITTPRTILGVSHIS